MSRSYRKNLVFPICCCNTQKKWKQQYNRIFRRNAKRQLDNYITNTVDDYKYENVYKRSYADIWSSPSDGKWWYYLMNPDEFQLDQDKYTFKNYKNYKEYLDTFKRKYISK